MLYVICIFNSVLMSNIRLQYMFTEIKYSEILIANRIRRGILKTVLQSIFLSDEI